MSVCQECKPLPGQIRRDTQEAVLIMMFLVLKSDHAFSARELRPLDERFQSKYMPGDTSAMVPCCRGPRRTGTPNRSIAVATGLFEVNRFAPVSFPGSVSTAVGKAAEETLEL